MRFQCKWCYREATAGRDVYIEGRYTFVCWECAERIERKKP